MANIELVIKVDTADYEYIKNGCIIPIKIDNHIYDAIRNGTPLPKGHGRLIDADELKHEIFHGGLSYYKKAESIIDNVSAIIEADKESEDMK